MKIALIDNMNNMMFSLSRYLHDMGHEADLFVRSDGYSHFSPEADCYSPESLEYVNKEEKKFYLYSKRELLHKYGKYDVIIGSGYSPYQLECMGRDLDVFVPHGSDFFSYPLKPFGLTPRRLFVYSLGKKQKRGIEHSRFIHMNQTNDEQERLIPRFKIKGEIIKKPVPFIYYPQYDTVEFDHYKNASSNYAILLKIREKHELLVFHHSSHQWKNPAYSLSQKKNDVLIRGFADFIKSSNDYKACLVMIEYGPDVAESKKLIRDLKIEKYCYWIPSTTRKEIMSLISLADLGAGEFGHSWLTYGTILEYMAMGVPVMHYREDAQYASIPEQLYKMYNAKCPDEVAAVLELFKIDTAAFKRTGYEAKQWFRKHVIEEPLRFYLDCVLR